MFKNIRGKISQFFSISVSIKAMNSFIDFDIESRKLVVASQLIISVAKRRVNMCS